MSVRFEVNKFTPVRFRALDNGQERDFNTNFDMLYEFWTSCASNVVPDNDTVVTNVVIGDIAASEFDNGTFFNLISALVEMRYNENKVAV